MTDVQAFNLGLILGAVGVFLAIELLTYLFVGGDE